MDTVETTTLAASASAFGKELGRNVALGLATTAVTYVTILGVTYAVGKIAAKIEERKLANAVTEDNNQ